MKSFNFNRGWEFAFDNDLDAYNHYGLYGVHRSMGAMEWRRYFNDWKKVELPHDWAIGLPKDLRGNTYSGTRAQTHYNRYTTDHNCMIEEVFSIGWYRKEFPWQSDWKGKRVFLEFEGIYRNADFWVNGVYMDNHASGYTSYLFEITDFLYEDDINSVAVRVDAEQAEGWWYEGAGIYRNVNLIIGEPMYFKPYETVVKADIDGKVYAEARLVNDTDKTVTTPVKWSVLDKKGNTVATFDSAVTIPAFNEAAVCAELQVNSPALWSTDEPNLYTLHIEATDTEEVTFGFRCFEFKSDTGFYLNGKNVKIWGACCHQDHGGVGVAVPDNLIRYRIRKLKEMGVNAYRSSHHAPSPALLRICDEEGMLVMDETRMYGPSPMAMRQLEELVKRDRNHPCVFMWCVGNEEIWLQHSEFGRNLGVKMRRRVMKLDGTRPCTYAGNSNDSFVGIAPGMDVTGINYLRNVDADTYHEDNPDKPVIGTEETSFVSSRACLVTDYAGQELVSSGNVTMGWSSTAKGWVKYISNRPWYMGSFMWTGFDYHGEPCPYVHSAFSTYFGAYDLAGMEKPIVYYYHAWWKNEPMLKLTPHWNHHTAEKVTVNVFTNCEHITLKLNGKVVAQRDVERYDAPEFELMYEPGVLEAEGVKDGKIYRDVLRTSGAPATLKQELVLKCEKDSDVGIIEITAVDKDGIVCADNTQRIALSLTGGDIVGVCNGDSQDPFYEQKPAEYEYHYVRAFETEYGLYAVPPMQDNAYSNSPYRTEGKQTYTYTPGDDKHDDDYRYIAARESIRKMYDPKEYTFITHAKLSEDFSYLEFQRLYGKAKVYLDGVEIGSNALCTTPNARPFRFYCDGKAGVHEIKVVTTLDDGTHGGMSGYVRFGKEVNKNNWITKLYGGKTRVFVKYTGDCKLDAKFV